MRTIIRNTDSRTRHAEFVDDTATTALQVLFVVATFVTIAFAAALLQSIAI